MSAATSALASEALSPLEPPVSDIGSAPVSFLFGSALGESLSAEGLIVSPSCTLPAPLSISSGLAVPVSTSSASSTESFSSSCGFFTWSFLVIDILLSSNSSMTSMRLLLDI